MNAMAKQWYFVKDGKPQGPFSALELKQKADSGELRPDDPIRPEDRQNWVKAAAVKGLFAAKTIAPPPPPSSPTAPPPLPASSLPPPLPTGSADSQSESLNTGNGPQHSIRLFAEWYRMGWVSQKSGRVQFIVWVAFGFVWIPYWYLWTATPPGSLRGKWASLGRGGKIGYAVLTGLVCLVAVRIFINPHHSLAVRSATSPNLQGSASNTADAFTTQKSPFFAPRLSSTSLQSNTEASYKVAMLDTPCAEFKASLGFDHLYLSSDGRFLSNGRELWHVPSRSVVQLDIPGNEWIRGRFSPDGQLFACLSKNLDMLYVFSLNQDGTATCPGKWPLNRDKRLLEIEWSHDGESIAVASNHTAFILFDWRHNRDGVYVNYFQNARETEFLGAVSEDAKVVLSPTGKLLAVCSKEIGVQVYSHPFNTEGQRLSFPACITKWAFTNVRFSPDGKILATELVQESGRHNGVFNTSRKWTYFWNTKTWQSKLTLCPKPDDEPNNDSSPKFLGFTGNGSSILVSSEEDYQVQDAESGKRLGSIKPVGEGSEVQHNGYGDCLCFSQTSGPVQIWDTDSYSMRGAITNSAYLSYTRHLAVSLKAKFVALVDRSNPSVIHVWDSSKGSATDVKEIALLSNRNGMKLAQEDKNLYPVTSSGSQNFKIIHSPFTWVFMPDIPTDRRHYSDPHLKQALPDDQASTVLDIGKVDFAKGPNGEPIEARVNDSYIAYYFYRDANGCMVMHGPCVGTAHGHTTWWYVSLYVYGQKKAENDFAVEDQRELKSDIYLGDTQHTEKTHDVLG